MQCAETSWNWRGKAKKHGLSFDEEAITQIVLMDLAESYPGDVTIVQLTKPQEGKIGADWAWAFVNADGSRVLPMLVQAKVLDLQDKLYPKIKYTIGKSKIRQIDRLISRAKNLGWPAMYAFYNHLSDTTRLPDNCGTMQMANIELPEAWGISLAEAGAVRSILDPINDQNFDSHAVISKPLHCMLCSRGIGRPNRDGSPASAADSINALKQMHGRIDLAGDEPYDETAVELLDSLPDLFEKYLRLKDIDDPQQREILSQELLGERPNIRGVVIVKDSRLT